MIHSQPYNIYIASCTEDGGIYHYKKSEKGVELISFTPLDRPMYMIIEDKKMYILLRAPFDDNNNSGLIIYDIDDSGKLYNPSKIVSTKGVVACHLAVHNGDVYAVNYLSGSVIKIPEKVAVHKGRGPHPTRQEAPHTHFVGVTPDNKYLLVTDLGLDTVFVYDFELNLINKVSVPTGHGARHIAFYDDGKYCFVVNELKSTVSAFSYGDGSFELICTENALPDDFTGESTAAAIRYKDGFIYVSNRGHDSISKMSFEKNALKLEKTFSTKGKNPRDFIIKDNTFICTNQDSDNVTFFDCKKDDFIFEASISVKTPICVVTD